MTAAANDTMATAAAAVDPAEEASVQAEATVDPANVDAMVQGESEGFCRQEGEICGGPGYLPGFCCRGLRCYAEWTGSSTKRCIRPTGWSMIAAKDAPVQAEATVAPANDATVQAASQNLRR